MGRVPVYQHSGSYAQEHNELEQYRASHKANIACKDAIETAIRDSYHSNCLGEDAGKQVVGQFGFDRVFYVLANTIRRKEWDGRFSYRNKEWANTVPVCADEDAWGGDKNRYFVVDAVNPGLTDLFINQVRREYLLTQPLTKQDIQAEAARLLRHLQSERGIFAFIRKDEPRDQPLRLKLSERLKSAQQKLDAEARRSVPKQRETRQI